MGNKIREAFEEFKQTFPYYRLDYDIFGFIFNICYKQALSESLEEIERLKRKNRELQYVIDCMRGEAYEK